MRDLTNRSPTLEKDDKPDLHLRTSLLPILFPSLLMYEPSTSPLRVRANMTAYKQSVFVLP